MSKRAKKLLMILIPALIMFIGLYLMVDAVYIPETEELYFPDSELTSSIFTKQNNTYVENSALSAVHKFSDVPYKVDVPVGSGATIGTGTIYQVSDTIFVYVSEYNDTSNIQDIIAQQFPAALLINYVPEDTKIIEKKNQEGFINGFVAEYVADQIYVTNKSSSSQAIVLGYGLDMSDEQYVGNHLFISVCSTDINNKSISNCATVLSAIMKTVRYDAELGKQLAKSREAAEKEAQEKSEEDMTNTAGAAAEASSEEKPTVKFVDDSLTKTYEIVLSEEYVAFELDVTWENSNTTAVLELFTEDGSTYYTPASQDETSATFILQNVPAGTLYLRVMNYADCGGITTITKDNND